MYLHAGTDGPIPAAAGETAARALAEQVSDGRYVTHFLERQALQTRLREAYASLLGAPPEEVSLTTSTSEGLGKVLAGMTLGPGDEILTSDQEHPGLIGPLLAARRRGVRIRTAPLTRLAEGITDATTLIAVSHVGWLTGELLDPAVHDAGIPVILDGAQSVGAIQVDVKALGCAAFAGPGQKWLCGADGTGMLYLSPAFRERVRAIAPGYLAFVTPSAGLESDLHPDGRAYDTPSLSRESVALSLASFEAVAAFGWDAVLETAVAQAERLARRLDAAGRVVAPRGPTTLVSWESPDPTAEQERLFDAGIILRQLPGTPYVRASVGAYNDDSDLERLLEAL